MHIHPAVASVVGQVSDTRWGQVLLTPSVYGVIQTYTPDGIARQKGVEILTKLTQAVSDPPVSLSALLHIADHVMARDIESLVLLVPVGSVLYLVCRGEGAVYLKRGNKLAVLLDAPGGLSGAVQQGDTIIVASSGFVQALSRDDILGVFDHLSPQEVAEKLTLQLHMNGGGEGGAALIFHIEAVKDESMRQPEVAQPLRPVTYSGFHRYTAIARDAAKPQIMRALRRFTNPRQRIVLRKKWMAFDAKVHHISPKKAIAGIVITLFILSVFFGMLHQQAGVANSKIVDVLAASQHAFDEGMALGDLNPVKGRERLQQAKDMLAPIIAKKSHSQEARQAQELYTQISENLAQAMHITHVRPELFFDVSLLKSGAAVSDMSLFEDTLGLLDSSGKTVYSLDVTTKGGSVAAGGAEFTDATHIASYADALYVLGPKGVTRVKLSDQKTTPNVIPAAPEWGNVTAMVAFGGNLYMLDIVKSRIWKYVATEKGFSELREYLNPDAFPDLSAATSMVIDGSVWLGSIHGVLPRFTLGKENSFTPQGVVPPLGKNLMVYTSDESKLVYILDKDAARVVVTDKDGMYMAQYVWESAFAPTAFTVSESVKKILLLQGGKIYAVSL